MIKAESIIEAGNFAIVKLSKISPWAKENNISTPYDVERNPLHADRIEPYRHEN